MKKPIVVKAQILPFEDGSWLLLIDTPDVDVSHVASSPGAVLDWAFGWAAARGVAVDFAGYLPVDVVRQPDCEQVD